MEIVPSIAVSSLVGAVLFFTGGRFSTRATAPVPPALPAPLPPDDAARVRAEADAAGARRAAEEVARALVEEQAHSAALGRAVADEQEKSAALGRVVEEERARSAALGRAVGEERTARVEAERRAGSDVQRMGEDGGRLRAQAAELDAQLADARRKNTAAAAEATRLKTQASAATSRAVAAEKRAAELAAEVADVPRVRAEIGKLAAAGEALSAENAALRRAAEAMAAERATAPPAASVDLQRILAENAALRREVAAREDAAREVQELRRRVHELTALGFAQSIEEPPPPSRPPAEGAGLSTVLERELGRLVDHEDGCRMAVLSDMRGLLVAASAGAAYPHELAAAASLTTYAADRLRDLLPLGEAASLLMEDVNGVTVRTRWLRVGDECFLVSTVGVIEPGGDDASGLRARLVELVGEGAA